jgi:hypothetical protein
MGVFTSIRTIRNNSPFNAIVRHNEDRVEDSVNAGDAISYGRNVPWCNNQTEFVGRHIYVRLIRPDAVDIYHGIWQRDVGGDNRVRSSRNEEAALWVDPGDSISGQSGAGGNRGLFIDANSEIRLDPSA